MTPFAPHYYALRERPDHPEDIEAHEAIETMFRTREFTKGDAIGTLIDQLDVEARTAGRRFQRLVSTGAVCSLS